MPASTLGLPFLISDVPSTVGLMESFLPLCRPAIDVQNCERPSPLKRIGSIENRLHRKEHCAIVKSRRKGKERKRILGRRRESVCERTSQKKAIRWAGRTIYSLHAAMSLATKPMGSEPLQPQPQPYAWPKEEIRLSKGRDFLPLIEDKDEEAVIGKRTKDCDREEDKAAVTLRDSTPELGCWSASSSASLTSTPLPDEGEQGVLQSAMEHDWSGYASGGEDGGVLGLWFGEIDLERVANKLFLQYVDVKE